MSTCQRKFSHAWYRAQRLKSTSLTEQAYTKDEPRFHAIFDLVVVGLGVIFPMSLFVLCGQASKDLAGPSAILAAIFAALTSGFSGLSYSELRARVCRVQASAYEYMYRVTGEMAAFVIGWLLFLHHVMCSSAASRAISQNLDYLLDNHISNFTTSRIGTISFLNSYLDFVGLFVCLLAMTASVINISFNGKYVRLTMIGLCVFVLVFVLVVGLYHLDFHHWQDVTSFFPEGIEGMMGAAVLFTYAFSGAETVLRSCDLNTRGLRKPAMTSILVIHIFMLVALILLTSAITLLTGQWQSSTPFPEAFTNAGMSWMRYIICTAALLILPSVLLDQLRQAVKILSSMASDGLLPGLFANRNQRTDTAIGSVLVSGIISSLFAFVFSVTDLIQCVAVPIVLMQITTCVVTICFHYKAEQEHVISKPKRKRRKKQAAANPSNGDSSGATAAEGQGYGSTQAGLAGNLEQLPDDFEKMIGQTSPIRSVPSNNNNTHDSGSSSDTDIDEVVEEYTHDQRVRELTENSSPADYRQRSTVDTSRRARAALAVFMISAVVMGLVVTRGSARLRDTDVWLIVLLSVSIAVLVICTAVVAKQPRDTIQPYTIMMYVPHVPWTPLIALVMNAMICAGFGATSALVVFLWILTGTAVYVFYGINHSHEAQFQDQFPGEHRGLIQTSSSTSQRPRGIFQIVPESQDHVIDNRDDDALIDCS